MGVMLQLHFLRLLREEDLIRAPPGCCVGWFPAFARDLGLSHREAQALASKILGYHGKTSADRLGVSGSTLRTFWMRIRDKSGCDSRAGVISLAVWYVSLARR